MKSPDSLVYVRLNIEFAVAGKQKRNHHRQLFFFRSSTLLSSNSNKCPCFTTIRVSGTLIYRESAWQPDARCQNKSSENKRIKFLWLFSLTIQYLLNYAVNVLKNMKIWNYSLGDGILNDLFYFFWGISGFQGCDSYLRAKRCIVVAEQHCEASLIENYPGSTNLVPRALFPGFGVVVLLPNQTATGETNNRWLVFLHPQSKHDKFLSL